MGTIQKRDDNTGPATYQARVRCVGYPPLSKNFPSSHEAQVWIDSAEGMIKRDRQERAAAELRKKLGLTLFRDFIERYLEQASPAKKSYSSEKYRLEKLLRGSLVEYPITSLSPMAIAEWRDKRLKEVKPDTVTRELHSMSRVVTLARKEWGLELEKNPFTQVTKPKCSKGRVRRLSENEALPLLEAAEKSRGGFLRTLILFAVETTMRRGEILGLDWQNIDLERQTAYLPDTKNGDHRSVPLSLKAVAILRTLTIIDLTPDRAGPVFPGVTGNAVRLAFVRACKRAGIENLHFHDLRHEGISRLFEKGLNPMEVSFISGHKDLRMLKRYTHLEAPKLAKKLG